MFWALVFTQMCTCLLSSFVMVTRELSTAKIVLERVAATNSVDVQHSDPPQTLSNITPHQLVRGGGSPVPFLTPDTGPGPTRTPNNGALRRPHSPQSRTISPLSHSTHIFSFSLSLSLPHRSRLLRSYNAPLLGEGTHTSGARVPVDLTKRVGRWTQAGYRFECPTPTRKRGIRTHENFTSVGCDEQLLTIVGPCRRGVVKPADSIRDVKK